MTNINQNLPAFMRWGNRAVANHVCKTVYQSACTIIYCTLAPEEDIRAKSGEILYECRPQNPVLGTQVFDRFEQNRLWQVSEEVTSVTFPS